MMEEEAFDETTELNMPGQIGLHFQEGMQGGAASGRAGMGDNVDKMASTGGVENKAGLVQPVLVASGHGVGVVTVEQVDEDEVTPFMAEEADEGASRSLQVQRIASRMELFDEASLENTPRDEHAAQDRVNQQPDWAKSEGGEDVALLPGQLPTSVLVQEESVGMQARPVMPELEQRLQWEEGEGPVEGGGEESQDEEENVRVLPATDRRAVEGGKYLVAGGDDQEEREDDESRTALRAVLDGVPFEWRLLDVANAPSGEGQAGWGVEGYLERQRGRMYRLEELKRKLENSTVPCYAEDLVERADELPSLSIMSVPAEQIRSQERDIEAARVAEQQILVDRQRRRAEKIALVEAEGKRRVEEEELVRAERLKEVREKAVAVEKHRQKEARGAYRQGREEIEVAMRKQSERLRKQAGVLTEDKTGSLKLLSSWKMSAALSRAPQPIKIHLKCLRGAKDRLQRGHYVLVASLVERVGGDKMRWSGGGDHTMARSRPKMHLGRFYDVSVAFEEHIFLLVPPRDDARAGMSLMFELVQCKSRLINEDTCVGWAIFPVFGTQREVLDGRYRVPFLRGDANAWNLESHRGMEKAIQSGLHNWLGNLYFRVSVLSRFIHGSRERAIRLHHTSDLLGFEPPQDVLSLPSSYRNTARSNAGGASQHSSEASQILASPLRSLRHSFSSDLEVSKEEKARTAVNWHKVFLGEKLKVEAGWDPEGDGLSDVSDSDDPDDDVLPEHLMAEMMTGKPSSTSLSSRSARQQQALALRDETGTIVQLQSAAEDSASGDEMPDEDALLGMGKRIDRPIDEGRKAMREAAGEVPSKRRNTASPSGSVSGSEERQLQPVPSIPKTVSFQSSAKVKKPLAADDDEKVIHGVLSKFTAGARKVEVNAKKPGVVAVVVDPTLTRHTLSVLKGTHKDKESGFLSREVLSDIGLMKLRPWTGPATALVVGIVAFLIRVQIHYMGELGLLLILQRPLYEVTASWERWTIRSSPISNPTANEFGLLCAGPLFVNFFFATLTFSTWLVSTVFRVDALVYTFICIFGFLAALDPFFIILVDILTGNLSKCVMPDMATISLIKDTSILCSSDVMRLWFHFKVREGNGTTGLAMAVVVYACLSAIFLVFLYTAMLNVHFRGRILDTYRRLTAREETMLCPLDMEISLRELKDVLHRSRLTHRQIVVTDLLVTYVGLHEKEISSPDAAQGYDDKMTHIAIYTLPEPAPGEVDIPAKMLYRHFVTLPDGAIVELIGADASATVSGRILTTIRDIVAESVPTKYSDAHVNVSESRSLAFNDKLMSSTVRGDHVTTPRTRAVMDKLNGRNIIRKGPERANLDNSIVSPGSEIPRLMKHFSQ